MVASQAVTTSKWDLLDNGKDDESSVKGNPEEDLDGAPIDEERTGSEDGEYQEEEEEERYVSVCLM